MSNATKRIRAERASLAADVDVRAIRFKLELDQEDFASQFGFSVSQIRDWEQRRSRPVAAMRAYLLIIDRDPDAIRSLLAAAMRSGG